MKPGFIGGGLESDEIAGFFAGFVLGELGDEEFLECHAQQRIDEQGHEDESQDRPAVTKSFA